MRFSRSLFPALAVSALLAGCSSGTVDTAPVRTPPTSASQQSATPAAPAPDAPTTAPTTAPSTAPPVTPQSGGEQQQAQVGDTLELTGNDTGSRMEVVVTRVVDPAPPADDILTPGPGDRFVSVQFRLHNVGSAAYADSPSNGAAVVDSSGQGYDGTAYDTTAGPSFPANEHVAPGGTALGYVTFEVPNGIRLALVQFTLDSGFANDTGQWSVNRTVAGSVPAAPPASPPASSAPAPAPATTPADDPGGTVEAYYADINAHDYQGAWALGGKNLNHSYQDFAAGFATTASDTVTVDAVHGDTVSVDLDALQTDGSHRHFSGSYTVVDGVIVSAAIH